MRDSCEDEPEQRVGLHRKLRMHRLLMQKSFVLFYELNPAKRTRLQLFLRIRT